MLCFYKNLPAVVLVIFMGTNLLYGIYMIKAKAFENKYLNQQDFINELIVSFSTFWMVLYTCIVKSKEDQHYLGKLETCVLLFYCTINLLIIICSTVFNNKKVVVYLYNLINHKRKIFHSKFKP